MVSSSQCIMGATRWPSTRWSVISLMWKSVPTWRLRAPPLPWRSVRISGRGRGLFQWSERLVGSWRVIGPSVTVRADCWRSFPLPLRSFGLRVLLLLKYTNGSHDHGADWLQTTWHIVSCLSLQCQQITSETMKTGFHQGSRSLTAEQIQVDHRDLVHHLLGSDRFYLPVHRSWQVSWFFRCDGCLQTGRKLCEFYRTQSLKLHATPASGRD